MTIDLRAADMTSTIHLVAGHIGAGKTTYSRDLADRVEGVSFSIDDWMVALFGPDMPTPLDPEWIFKRAKRCNERIMHTAISIATRRLDVVLDLGLTAAEDRSAAAEAVLAAGLKVKLHWLDVPVAERWARVEARNSDRGSTYSFAITRQMFDFMEARVEEPGEEEMLLFNGDVFRGL
jgi:predicted kinase